MTYSIDKETMFVVIWSVLMTVVCAVVFFGLSPTSFYNASVYTFVALVLMVIAGIIIYKMVIENQV